MSKKDTKKNPYTVILFLLLSLVLMSADQCPLDSNMTSTPEDRDPEEMQMLMIQDAINASLEIPEFDPSDPTPHTDKGEGEDPTENFHFLNTDHIGGEEERMAQFPIEKKAGQVFLGSESEWDIEEVEGLNPHIYFLFDAPVDPESVDLVINNFFEGYREVPGDIRVNEYLVNGAAGSIEFIPNEPFHAGSLFWVHLNHSVLRDQTGRPLFVYREEFRDTVSARGWVRLFKTPLVTDEDHVAPKVCLFSMRYRPISTDPFPSGYLILDIRFSEPIDSTSLGYVDEGGTTYPELHFETLDGLRVNCQNPTPSRPIENTEGPRRTVRMKCLIDNGTDVQRIFQRGQTYRLYFGDGVRDFNNNYAAQSRDFDPFIAREFDGTRSNDYCAL